MNSSPALCPNYSAMLPNASSYVYLRKFQYRLIRPFMDFNPKLPKNRWIAHEVDMLGDVDNGNSSQNYSSVSAAGHMNNVSLYTCA